MHFHLLLLSALCCAVSLNPGSKGEKGDEAIHYFDLAPDEGSYKAVIKDGLESIEVTNFSFGGKTSLAGVKKETDKSVSTISLDQISSFFIVDPLFSSKRYQAMELTLVMVTTTSNKSEEMLFPRHLVVCGQDRETGIKKAWPLRKITSIRLEHYLNEELA